MNQFYTYMWLREDGTPYYVGKGHGNRSHWRGIKSKLKPPTEDRIIVQEFDSEEDAFFSERLLISYYGRKDTKQGILVNHTDGGDGVTGLRHTEDSKKRIAEGLKGRHYGIGRVPWNKGLKVPKTLRKPLSEEHKERIRQTLRSKNIKPPNQTGYRHSESAKVKIGIAAKETWKKAAHA